MLSVLWGLIMFTVSLSILITVHEFGHFFAARRCGVQVERFSIGFGKILWKYTDRYGTEFVVSLILLGGYTKMLGDRIESVAPEIRHCAFDSKSISQRAAIIAAGPVANFIFAILVYWLLFVVGVPGIRPIVDEIIPGSIAESAQITQGMEIKAINGIEIHDWDSFRLQLISRIGDNRITVSVVPFDSNQQQDKVLNLHHLIFNPGREDPIISLGICPKRTQIDLVLTEVQSGSAANKAGLQIGDRIVRVNGQSLIKWTTFANLVRDNPGRPLTLEVERKGNLLSFILVPDIKSALGKVEGFAGVMPKVVPLSDMYKIQFQYEPLSAIFKAVNKTWQLISLNVTILGKLIIGDIKLSNLGGPISIAQGAVVSAELGVIYYLMFLALTSVNLGIINLFPLSVLDGGRLFFLVIEKLKGKLVSKRIQDFERISSILLMLLIGLVLLNDLSHL